MKNSRPFYIHVCRHCTALGSYTLHGLGGDLYICHKRPNEPALVSRFSDGLRDFYRWDVSYVRTYFADSTPHMREAYVRSLKAELLTDAPPCRGSTRSKGAKNDQGSC